MRVRTAVFQFSRNSPGTPCKTRPEITPPRFKYIPVAIKGIGCNLVRTGRILKTWQSRDCERCAFGIICVSVGTATRQQAKMVVGEFRNKYTTQKIFLCTNKCRVQKIVRGTSNSVNASLISLFPHVTQAKFNSEIKECH